MVLANPYIKSIVDLVNSFKSITKELIPDSPEESLYLAALM